MEEKNKNLLPLGLNVWVCINRKGDPCIKLQKETSNHELIKTIVYCALKGKPLIVQPIFNNNLNALNSLIEKGIVYREGENIYFTEDV